MQAITNSLKATANIQYFLTCSPKINLSRTCLLETGVKDNVSWYLERNTTSISAPHMHHYLWQIITCKLVSIIQSCLVSQHGMFCKNTQCQIIPVITCHNSRKADRIVAHCTTLSRIKIIIRCLITDLFNSCGGFENN